MDFKFEIFLNRFNIKRDLKSRRRLRENHSTPRPSLTAKCIVLLQILNFFTVRNKLIKPVAFLALIQ